MAETKIKKVVAKKASVKKSVDKADLLIEWVKAYIEAQGLKGGNVDFEKKQKAQSALADAQQKIMQL